MRSEFSAQMHGPRVGRWPRAGQGRLVSRAVMGGLAAAAAAGLVAACGSGGTSRSPAAASPAAASHGTVVSVRNLPGIGNVLVARSGMTVGR